MQLTKAVRRYLRGITGIRPLQSHGIMSSIFTGLLGRKKVVIKIAKLTHEQRRQQIWRKPEIVYRIIRSNSVAIPVPKVYRAARIGSFSVTVEEFLRGSNLGKRSFKGNIRDYCSNRKAIPALMGIVRRFHSVKLKRFGNLVSKDGGPYSTWKDYFTDQSSKCIAFLRRESPYFSLTAEQEAKIFSLIDGIDYAGPPVLIHGDISNLSNILVTKNRITGVIDFEWSLAGDPVYGFVFGTTPSLRAYGAMRDDWRRKRIYEVLWWLWACSVHPKSSIGVYSYETLCKKLARF